MAIADVLYVYVVPIALVAQLQANNKKRGQDLSFYLSRSIRVIFFYILQNNSKLCYA